MNEKKIKITMENLKYAENRPPGWYKSILVHFKNKAEALDHAVRKLEETKLRTGP